jgi:hypothetical protein
MPVSRWRWLAVLMAGRWRVDGDNGAQWRFNKR